MFVQVIKGKTSDAAGLLRQNAAWVDTVRPGARGFLGSTFGLAEDGTCVVLARFADEAAARANSDRPEQGAWWKSTVPFFAGEPTFRESSDVATLFDGGSDKAGFVQVMEGTAHDRVKADEMETPELLAELRAARPDLLGSLRVWLPGGAYVEAAYFTSEAEARTGETSSEFSVAAADYSALFGEMEFTDLRELRFSGPAGS
jgi:hypothetical protein